MSSPPRSEFIEESPGIEIHKELDSLKISLDIQKGNYEELLAKHESFRSYSFEEWENTSPIKLMKKEYYRPFHNYIASVYTVIKHSQRIVDKFGGDDFYEQYTNEIVDRNLDKRGEFLRELRHYTQKRKVPPLESHLEYNAEGVAFEILVPKEQIIDWQGWSNTSKAFLKQLDSKVHLLDIINRYQEESENFYDWFFKYARLYFKEELTDALERIIFVEKMKEFLPEPEVHKRPEPFIHGYREREIIDIPTIPERYMHPYDPTNILGNL